VLLQRQVFGLKGNALPGEAVEETAGAVEFWEEFFLGAEFAGVGDERAAGAARGMFDVEHFVVEDIFDDELRDKRMIHAAIEQDLIGAGIVAAELSAPTAIAPAEMRAGERAAEKFLIEGFEHGREIEVKALRVGGGGADARAAHTLNALAGALGAGVSEIGLDEEFWRAAAINAGEKERGGAFEHRQGALAHEIGEADEDGFFAAANGEDEIGVRIKFDVKARRAAFAAESRENSLEESGATGKEAVRFLHRKQPNRS
jgi:hypothetical protein